MATIRHEFYETDEKVTLSIFDKGADPDHVSISILPRSLSYTNGDKKLVLSPLKGQIDPSKSDYTVGRVKIEVRLAKISPFRWGTLVGDSPDLLANQPSASTSISPPPAPDATTRPKPRKNWEGISDSLLKSEKAVTPDQDPNAGGDAAVNEFFQQIFTNADDETRRAMMKSYQESGGTTLSTNWDEVSKGRVEVKPPQGSEWKKWAA